MAEPYYTTVDEIERLCRYINDNGTIAAYFGIDRNRVQRVRDKMHTPRFKINEAGHPPTNAMFNTVPDRTPCPRCGVRKDIGCGHSTVRLVA